MAYIEKRSTGWRVQVRRKGWKNVSRTFRTKAAAERWSRDVESGMDSRIWVEADQKAPVTLHDLLDRYLSEVSCKKKGFQDESYRLRRVMKADIGKVALDRLTPAMFATWRDERLREVSGPTVRKDLSILSDAINVAIREWGVGIGINPVSMISKPLPNKPRDRRLSTKEYEDLFAAISTCRNMWIKPIVIFALETAMRRGEILSLTWENVDLQTRVAFLSVTKNGESRSVPLSSVAVKVIKNLSQESHLVFNTTANSVRMSFDRVVKRASIQDFRFHDLRHEATSRLFEKSLNIMEVSSITGHKDLRMLKRYTHLRAEDLAHKLD